MIAPLCKEVSYQDVGGMQVVFLVYVKIMYGSNNTVREIHLTLWEFLQQSLSQFLASQNLRTQIFQTDLWH